jgi:hypothetical protein
VVDQRRVVAFYRAGCVKQCRKQILLNVSDIGSVLVQAFKNVLDVCTVQLQKSFLNERGGIIVAGHADRWFGGTE